MSSTPTRGEIHLVDGDPALQDAIAPLLAQQGYETVRFKDGDSLLAAMRRRMPACIMLDLDVPGRSGLEVLRELRANGCSAPILVISGKGNIATAVEALKSGADDYIEKPFNGRDLAARLSMAMRSHEPGDDLPIVIPSLPGREPLTLREREVLEQCVLGASAKEAGAALGLSPRTIEDYRARILRKLAVRNVTELARLVFSSSVNRTKRGRDVASTSSDPAAA